MQSSWSISNADSYLEPAVIESFMKHSVPAWIMLGVFVVCGSYPLFHRIYQMNSTKYREELTNDQQLVVIQHTVEAIFLSLLFAPCTWLILSLFFEEQSVDSLSKKFQALVSLFVVVIIMYMVEIASRFRSIRPIVFAHHIAAYFEGAYAAFFLTTANVKAALLLIYFTCYEAIAFFGLIMYRLAPTHCCTRPIIMLGIITFGISRPFQIIWVVGSLVATWDRLNRVHAIFQIVMTVLFTSLQLYSVTIHWSLYQKCGKALVKGRENVINATEKNEDEQDRDNGDSTPCQDNVLVFSMTIDDVADEDSKFSA